MQSSQQASIPPLHVKENNVWVFPLMPTLISLKTVSLVSFPVLHGSSRGKTSRERPYTNSSRSKLHDSQLSRERRFCFHPFLFRNRSHRPFPAPLYVNVMSVSAENLKTLRLFLPLPMTRFTAVQ